MYRSLDTWQQSGFFRLQAIYPTKGIEALEEVGLHHLLENPSTAKVAEHSFEVVGSGSFANVLEIDNSGIVVKQHQPWMNHYPRPKHVSGRALLRDLAVNVALEETLAGDDRYTTPQYLGHLMLSGPKGRLWHYTLMSKLDVAYIKYDKNIEMKWGCFNNTQYCANALDAAGYKEHFVEWDGMYLGHNIRLVDTPNGLRLAVFDQGHLLSRWKRPKPFATSLKRSLDCGSIRDPFTKTPQEKHIVYDGY